VTAITSGATVSTLLYNDAGLLLSESYSGGPLSGLTVSNRYDSFLRRTTNGMWNGSAWLAQSRYAYDAASRLFSVSDGTNSATYNYLTNSPLVSQIAFTNSSTQRMVTTKSYDYLNRLTSVGSTANSAAVASFGYQYNSANQRTAVTNADNSYWVYQYDKLGQVTSGRKCWSDGTPVAGQQFTYDFDDIGNRKTTAFGGDQNGQNLHSANYTNNSLNQITSRDVPGYVNDLGTATNTATVIVNNNGTVRHGDYYRAELAVNNQASAIYAGMTNLAILNNGTAGGITNNVTGSVFVPRTPETFGYDADGNLTNDGHWTYSWDAENRLTQLATNTAAGPQQLLKFDYDSKGRRVRKQIWNNGSGSGSPATDLRFAYDGWNLIATLNSQLSTLNSFMWGLDLSGSLQGAGGVGGLLQVDYYGAQATNCFVAFDGNGNVSALVNTANGTNVAQYEYGPFGEVARATGPMAKVNPFRFSTKYQDDETDLLYYGYRFCNQSMGRWLSRDPLGDYSFLSLYRSGKSLQEARELGWRSLKPLYIFVENDPSDRTDSVGLCFFPGFIFRCETTWHCTGGSVIRRKNGIFIDTVVCGYNCTLKRAFPKCNCPSNLVPGSTTMYFEVVRHFIEYHNNYCPDNDYELSVDSEWGLSHW
jgi:RHS repeat-associated protein